MPNLAGHISKMYEVLVEYINTAVRLMVLFTHTNELEIPELANANTDPTKKHQYNGDRPLLGTQTYSPQSPLTDTLVALDEPLPHPRNESRGAAFLERAGDLPDFCLLGADDILFGFYQYWVPQNTGNHLDGGITEDGKLQPMWKNCLYSNLTLLFTFRKSWEKICRNHFCGA